MHAYDLVSILGIQYSPPIPPDVTSEYTARNKPKHSWVSLTPKKEWNFKKNLHSVIWDKNNGIRHYLWMNEWCSTKICYSKNFIHRRLGWLKGLDHMFGIYEVQGWVLASCVCLTTTMLRNSQTIRSPWRGECHPETVLLTLYIYKNIHIHYTYKN